MIYLNENHIKDHLLVVCLSCRKVREGTINFKIQSIAKRDETWGWNERTRDPSEKKRSYQGLPKEEKGSSCKERRKQDGQCENVQISREGMKIRGIG